jgi:hypothetical protein
VRRHTVSPIPAVTAKPTCVAPDNTRRKRVATVSSGAVRIVQDPPQRR